LSRVASFAVASLTAVAPSNQFNTMATEDDRFFSRGSQVAVNVEAAEVSSVYPSGGNSTAHIVEVPNSYQVPLSSSLPFLASVEAPYPPQPSNSSDPSDPAPATIQNEILRANLQMACSSLFFDHAEVWMENINPKATVDSGERRQRQRA